jgi:hypothetical protein
MSDEEITFAEPDDIEPIGVAVDLIVGASWPFTGQDYVFIPDPSYGPPESGLGDWIPKGQPDPGDGR